MNKNSKHFLLYYCAMTVKLSDSNVTKHKDPTLEWGAFPELHIFVELSRPDPKCSEPVRPMIRANGFKLYQILITLNAESFGPGPTSRVIPWRVIGTNQFLLLVLCVITAHHSLFRQPRWSERWNHSLFDLMSQTVTHRIRGLMTFHNWYGIDQFFCPR